MKLHLPPLLEWQKQFFAKVELALADGESRFMLNVGRQAGKTTALLLWSLMWQRGALYGGHIGIFAPSAKHLDSVKDQIKRLIGEAISSPSPGGIGWDLITGGRLDLWPLGFGAIAAGRGRTYDAVLVDESAYVPNLASVLEANLTPTLSTTGGPLLLASTPAGINNDYHDLWRHTPERARFSGGSDLNPAISAEWLANKRRSMTELRYLQECEGVFCDVQGLKLKRSEVRYGKPPELSRFKTISMAIDPATSIRTSADYTAIAVCGIDREDRRWLLHLAHWRLSWGETETKLLGYYDAWRPHTVIFEAVNFAALGCRMLLDAGMPVRPIVPHKDKMTRFERLHVRYHMGDIWHSENLDQECENELYGFGSDLGSGHDDCVDATVYGFTPLFAELSTDWTELSSGAQWSGRLPHEKKRGTWCFDFWGKPHLLGGEPDYDEAAQDSVPNPETDQVSLVAANVASEPAKEPPAPWLPEFYEKLVGDEFVVIARDSGKELMRAHRCRLPFYQGLKNEGKLDWQVKGLDGYLKTL